MEKASPPNVIPFIAAIVFLDMAGVGIIIPVTPGLIGHLSGSNLQDSALIGGALLLIYSVMLFFFAPIIGGLSDRFGRRPVLLATLTAMGIDYLLMAWAPTLAWLFLGRAIAGVMGATWAASNSCIADCFPPEERGAKFGLIGGAGAAGFILGPALGGILGGINLRLPFLVAAGFAICGAILGWLRFPETLAKEERRAFTLSRANPLGTIIQMSRNPVVIGMLTVILLFQLASQATHVTWSFYLIEALSWTPMQIGIVTAVYGMLLASVQGLLTGKVIARFGTVRTALTGAAAALPAFLLLAFAGSGMIVYLGVAVGSLAGLFFPSVQSLMSERVDPDAQGELQGAVASTISIAAIAGPLVMPPLFATFSDKQGLYLPGAPFILSSTLAVAGILLLGWIVKQHISKA